MYFRDQNTTSKKSRTRVILIVVGSVVLLGLIGYQHSKSNLDQTAIESETQLSSLLQSEYKDEDLDDEVNLVRATKGILSLPYDSALVIGTGIDSSNAGVKANPFGVVGTIVEQKTVESDVIKRRIVTNAYEQAQSLEINASVSFSGWGASVKAKMANSNKSKLGVKEVKFVASRRIFYGFSGWQLAPKLSEIAKRILCKSEKDFDSTYGDYYVTGTKNGASLLIEVKSKTKSTNTSNAISASMEASFGGFGMSASAGGGFEKAVSKSSSISSSTVEVQMSGQDRGKGVTSLNIANANDQLLNFSKIAKHGTGLAVILKRYSMHPDYLATIMDPKCSRVGRLVNQINARAEQVIYEELVALQVVLDWCKAEREIPKKKIYEMEDEVWRKLSIISKLAVKGITIDDARKYRGSAQIQIDKFKALKDQYGSKDITKPKSESLDGKTFIIQNVYHDQNHENFMNKWISFRGKDQALRAVYSKQSDAMPIKFYHYAASQDPDIYIMKNVWPGQNKWISYSNDGHWLYARYNKMSDAMPVKIVKRNQNNDRTYKGVCYTMQSYWGNQPHKWISYANEGQFLREAYSNPNDAMTMRFIPH